MELVLAENIIRLAMQLHDAGISAICVGPSSSFADLASGKYRFGACNLEVI